MIGDSPGQTRRSPEDDYATTVFGDQVARAGPSDLLCVPPTELIVP